MDKVTFIERFQKVARKCGVHAGAIWMHLESLAFDIGSKVEVTYDQLKNELDYMQITDIVKGVKKLEDEGLLLATITFKNREV